MFQWFPVESSLLAAMILVCFACQINEQSSLSLSTRSILTSQSLPLSLSSIPCSSGNDLFEANEELFFARRSIDKVKIFSFLSKMIGAGIFFECLIVALLFCFNLYHFVENINNEELK